VPQRYSITEESYVHWINEVLVKLDAGTREQASKDFNIIFSQEYIP